jgi:hypothetical protein
MPFSLMYKLCFVLLSLIFLHGCGGQTTSILSSGATIASGGNMVKTILTAGTNVYIEKTTGKSAFQHVADNTVDAELRNCQIDHSAEINKIFFVTLDQFDCVLK